MTLKWLPNAVTIGRIGLAPVIGWLIWKTGEPANYAGSSDLFLAAILFAVAALSDGLDGWLARTLRAESELGANLDLWADKALVVAPLLGAVLAAPIIALCGLVCLTARDFLVMALRAVRPAKSLGATGLAKVKTACVMAGIGGGLFGAALDWPICVYASAGLFVMGCGLSLYTGLIYLRKAASASDL